MTLIFGDYTLYGTVDECLEFIRKNAPCTVGISSNIYGGTARFEYALWHGKELKDMNESELITAILYEDKNANKKYDLDTMTKEELINLLSAYAFRTIRNI